MKAPARAAASSRFNVPSAFLTVPNCTRHSQSGIIGRNERSDIAGLERLDQDAIQVREPPLYGLLVGVSDDLDDIHIWILGRNLENFRGDFLNESNFEVLAQFSATDLKIISTSLAEIYYRRPLVALV